MPSGPRVPKDCVTAENTPLLPGGGEGGGALGYILGGYVPPGSPNLDPVLERICTQNDTPF